MRDPKFIAAHRGGLLPLGHHRLLATWAADCAERLLPIFEKHSTDDRPRLAIAAARAWAAGGVKTGFCQKAAVAAHAAARSVEDPAATAAARACGHAAATAHMADHSLGPIFYGAKAMEASGKPTGTERSWQLTMLPAEIITLIKSCRDEHFPEKTGRE